MRRIATALVLFGSVVSAFGQTARERLDRLAKDYGIEIQVIDKDTKIERDGYNVSAKAVPDAMIEEYAPLFEAEWRKYPASLMPRVRLKRVVIGRDVRVLDQPRAAVPEFDPGWFWLDADVNTRRPGYGRHALHHDFFHMIDQWDSPDGRTDAVWKALNAPGTADGPGGWNMQTGNPGALRVDLPGFITRYATAATEEDKAEVYGHLLTSTAFISGRAALDPILMAKVRRMKELIATFEPAMGPGWWPTFPRVDRAVP
ncbi:hypothetical protein EON82_18050 [bacterium]|nr:MAG: hypothetical protein EON82_18050 [bacterium]